MRGWPPIAWIVVCGCTATPAAKMSWPMLPSAPSDHLPVALGGGIDERPAGPTVRRLVRHNTDLATPAPVSLVLQWPLPATGINSLYGTRLDPIDSSPRHHNGVDLDANYGAVVTAAAAGVVIWAGWDAGHGRRVLIEHVGGYRTGYSHLSQILTYFGDEVAPGDAVGLAGNSGRSTGPHLHFEISRDEVFIDPLEVLGLTLPLE